VVNFWQAEVVNFWQASGHHFADEEKHVARRIVEFLERDGILITKYNEGAHHVSVNPRRLREVGEIIGGTWVRMTEFDGP
jgi:hypothetical protein